MQKKLFKKIIYIPEIKSADSIQLSKYLFSVYPSVVFKMK